MKAIWHDVILAESDETVVVEGNHYFPPDAINADYITDNSKRTVCPWKGIASYYDVVVGEDRNVGAAWFYPDASEAAMKIKDYVAFWQGVEIKSV